MGNVSGAGKRRFRLRSRLFTFGRVQDCFAKFPHKIVAGSARVAAGSARALAQSVKLHGDIADVSFSRPYLAPGGRIHPTKPISVGSGNVLQEHWGLDAILTEGWGTPSSYVQRPLSAPGFIAPSDALFYSPFATQQVWSRSTGR